VTEKKNILINCKISSDKEFVIISIVANKRKYFLLVKALFDFIKMIAATL